MTLTIPEEHQKRILQKNLKMPEPIRGVMSPYTRQQEQSMLRELEAKEAIQRGRKALHRMERRR